MIELILGFTIAVGLCLCIPAVWIKVLGIFKKTKDTGSEDRIKCYIKGLKEYQNHFLDQKILDLPDEIEDKTVEKIVEKEVIKEVPIEVIKYVDKIVEVPAPIDPEDPRLEPMVDTLLEHLKKHVDPGDNDRWSKKYYDIVHKLSAIRGYDVDVNMNIADKSTDVLKGFRPIA